MDGIEISTHWGKGHDHRPDLCEHATGDGCMWCCERCNTDTHFCGGCGTVTDHQGSTCDECVILYG